MAPTTLPPITSLPSLSENEIFGVLDLLFEPTSELRSLALPLIRSSSYFSYPDLISAIRTKLLEIVEQGTETPKLHEILGSHPRLGQPKQKSAEEEELSEQSKQEQKQLREGDQKEAERLAELNELYEQKFPGLRYVVFVNGRGRGEIMENMEGRIARGDLREEEREGVRAMCDIANDRAKKLLAASTN
ncbi:Oxo-4-hydroxy-4-carboxy-5-ureidoimidazoline decarboxylase [Podospora australis]|uniref:Oxo-4-hydroxy-4-carboxy-5-ureidoimidazoline decarboxylase n=1 Tax=Podospora australis TaxID=1536484 RepID=A0AAN6WUH7_9PEZI|nr:Oxo-4-hydroxy-4-carboxy-5-ureidoimidazoline decarboxylase [Podospora australis]